jgi:hypothetical protein
MARRTDATITWMPRDIDSRGVFQCDFSGAETPLTPVGTGYLPRLLVESKVCQANIVLRLALRDGPRAEAIMQLIQTEAAQACIEQTRGAGVDIWLAVFAAGQRAVFTPRSGDMWGGRRFHPSFDDACSQSTWADGIHYGVYTLPRAMEFGVSCVCPDIYTRGAPPRGYELDVLTMAGDPFACYLAIAAPPDSRVRGSVTITFVVSVHFRVRLCVCA